MVVHPSFTKVDDVEKWKDARCPICMEHPHDAVLLICSSHEKGCHPYMCNTSRLHSNCLQQFCEFFHERGKFPSQDDTFDDETQKVDDETREDHRKQLKLVCPLCRGEIGDWIVVERPRSYMNAKTRSCACETCDYSGTYSELKEHVRIEHPMEGPYEVNAERQSEWRRIEQERATRDLISTLEPISTQHYIDDFQSQ